jgi:hypothetical protein
MPVSDALRDHGPVTDFDPPTDLLADPTWDAAQVFVHDVSEGPALHAAAGWVVRADRQTRHAGFVVLGLLGLNDDHAREQLLKSARAGSADLDAGVRMSVVAAIGNLSDCAAAHELLLGMIGDDDEAIVAQVVGSLAITATDPAVISDSWVQLVIGLLGDPRPLVQDWAAFALGTQTEVDSQELRDQLLRIAQTDLDDEDVYPAAEAAMGLARRGDSRVVQILEAHLADPDVGQLWLDAAAEIADPRLHPTLVRLREQVDLEPPTRWDDALAAALTSCSARPPAP